MQKIQSCQLSRLATPTIVLIHESVNIDLICIVGPFAKHLDEEIW